VPDEGTVSATGVSVKVGTVAVGETDDVTPVLLDEVLLDDVLLDGVLLVEAEDEGLIAAGFIKKEEDDICCSPLQSPW
jgi:hypothetical protein